MTDRTEPDWSGSIAVIGMAGRFPKANSIAAFWRLLRDGLEGIHRFSQKELIEGGMVPTIVQRPNYVPSKGMLDGAEEFESELFGFHPRDALVIDPQQRLLLECCWEALEDAGYDPFRYDGTIGVFAGVSMNSWLYQLYANQEVANNVSAYQLMISNDKDYAACRVSYQLDLRGPSISIQTACSTSLVAVASACQSLASGECEMALAGAASLAFPRKCGYLYEEGMILSPDGHCRVFDARAQGTVPGEGVAVVMLKRLSDAIADGDHIEAVIRGWAVNNDGANKIGFTAPSVKGQAEVIAAAQALAGISADTISYVEAHGTATPLGDPIEIAALTDAFRMHTSRTSFCRIGSVKSNLGHLDAAAGIAGLIKTVLALKYHRIPPSLHFENPNPEIDFAASPFVVNHLLTQWELAQMPRRAGVSSFGIGGTNCHLILEEAPTAKTTATVAVPSLIVFSGASQNAVEQLRERLANVLEEDEHSTADVAYTLQVGRAELRHRRALVCCNHEDPTETLRLQRPAKLISGETRDEVLPITFLFSGQGSQYTGMGRGLYGTFPIYREQIDRCADVLEETCNWDLREILFAKPDNFDAAARLDQTAIAQPALFATSYALAQTLISWGVIPESMVGHSIGELVAACLAGVMTLKDALQIVAKRGELMQSAPPGAMLAIHGQEAESIEECLRRDCEIAVRNAPGSIVVSGNKFAIYELQRELEGQNISTSLLRTSHGFHCSLMEPILDDFKKFLLRFELRLPKTPFVSTVTGNWISSGEATDPDYWRREIRETVQFEAAVRCVGKGRRRVLLEIGPGRVLQGLARQILGFQSEHVIISTIRSRDSDRDDAEILMESIGALWTAGTPIEWKSIHAGQSNRRISLPTYPFQRRVYLARRDGRSERLTTRVSQIERQPLGRWFYGPSWKRSERMEDDGTSAIAPRRWLIFCDNGGTARAVGHKLAEQGQDVIYVSPGDGFKQLAPNDYVIDPRLYGNYTQLINQVSSLQQQVDRVLHCWLLTEAIGDLSFAQIQQLGFYSLLFLSQTLGRRPVAGAVRIDLISSEVQDVLGNEPLCPAKATIRGPLLVIPQEYPSISCQHLDVPADACNQDREWLVEHILREARVEQAGNEAALRGRTRWLRAFERLRLPEKQNYTADKSGAWMIIGGFGRIGLIISGWLAHTKQVPLVLVGRVELPDPKEWSAWLENHDADDPISQRLSAIQELQKAGVEVSVATADIADPESLRKIAARTVEKFGFLGGIVHSAAVIESRIIHYTGPLDCERQFRAKVDGIAAVAEVARQFHVPTVLVNSSLSSQLGGIGFCAYTATNTYLDAFLRQENRRGTTRWIGINWDGWLFPYMADLVKDNPALHLSLTPDEGFECLNRINDLSGLNQVVVSTGSLADRLAAWVHRQKIDDSLAEQAGTESPLRHPRPHTLSTTYSAPRNDIEKTIVAVWEELLGIDSIGANDNYIELGGHSLLAGQIISRLRERLKTPISIRSLFEFPTITELAMHVEAVRLTFARADDQSAGNSRIEVEF